jgi:MFS family permease
MTVKSADSGDNSQVSIPTRLGLVSFLNDCSSEAIARALPLLLTTTLGTSAEFVGVVEGAAEALAILLRAVSGWLSDRMQSRKPLVFIGYFLSVAARACLLLAHLPIFFGAARLLDRTGKGIRTAPRDAFVADAAKEGRLGRAFGITRFLDTLGAIVSLLVALALGVGGGAVVTQSEFMSLVYVSLPFGLASLLFLALFVPRITRATKAKRYLSWHVPRGIRGYLAVVSIFALANSSDAFLVLRASQLGLKFSTTLVALVAFNALAALLAWPAGQLSDRWGRKLFLVAGWLVYGAAYAVMGLTASSTVFIAALLSYGLFYGLTEGIEKALLADLLPAEERGTGYGALQLVLGLSALPASLLTGYLMTAFSAAAAFSTCAGLAAIAAMCLLLLRL